MVPPEGWKILAWSRWCDGKPYRLMLEDFGHMFAFKTEYRKQANKRDLVPCIANDPLASDYVVLVRALTQAQYDEMILKWVIPTASMHEKDLENRP